MTKTNNISETRTEFLNRMAAETESTRKKIEFWNSPEANKQHYWSAPTYVEDMIAKYGADNIFYMGESYRSMYHDDYCTFTYWNNVTGEVFHDEWATAFACPAYDNYKITPLKEAFDAGVLDLKKMYDLRYKVRMDSINGYRYNIHDIFDRICNLGLKVTCNAGRKWRGEGYLIGMHTTSYRYAYPRYRTHDSSFGVTKTTFGKVYCPKTNSIETVNYSYLEMPELETLLGTWKTEMLDNLNKTSENDILVNNDNKFKIMNTNYIDFIEWMQKNFVHEEFDMSNAKDTNEEAKIAKEAAFKMKKLEELREWVRKNTDKNTEEEIEQLAQKIYNKRYK